MKLRAAALFILFKTAFSSLDPWSIGDGNVTVDSNGELFQVHHLVADQPKNVSVRLFNKNCVTELPADDVVKLKSQIYTANPWESPTVTISEKIAFANDGGIQDYMGSPVAISGSTIVSAAFMDDNEKGKDSGAAYIFNTDGQQLHKLGASDGGPGEHFGKSVGISGSTIVVGASGHDVSRGAAYIFSTDGQQLHKLVANDGVAGDKFGMSVGISGSTIVVGAPFDDNENGPISGAAYIFNTDGQQLHKLVANNGKGEDWFGESVGISGSTIVVGAKNDDDKGNSGGAAYIFNTDGQQLHKLVADDGAEVDYFGLPVAISGSNIVVGAYGKDDNGNNSGAAYAFNTEGQQLAKLVANDGAEGDHFGRHVGISGSTIVVSATANGGSVYVFNTDGQQLHKLGDNTLASSVGISGSTIVAGHPFDNNEQGVMHCGSAYIFTV